MGEGGVEGREKKIAWSCKSGGPSAGTPTIRRGVRRKINWESFKKTSWKGTAPRFCLPTFTPQGEKIFIRGRNEGSGVGDNQRKKNPERKIVFFWFFFFWLVGLGGGGGGLGCFFGLFFFLGGFGGVGGVGGVLGGGSI